ncbi:MAG: hypothetical protein ACRC5H_01775 [Treponemataceae bacterium]
MSVQFGYGHVLLNENDHALSIGGSFKTFVQFEMMTKSSITDFVSDISKLDMPMLLNVGLGLDVGILYNWANIISVTLMAYDIYTPVFVTKLRKNPYEIKQYQVLPIDFTVGLGINIPVSWSGKAISSWIVMFDYSNILQSFTPLERHPLLNIAVGTEIVFVNTIALRVGMNELYFHAGAGLRFGTFRIDVAAYGRELGKEPGARPQPNVDISLSFYR